MDYIARSVVLGKKWLSKKERQNIVLTSKTIDFSELPEEDYPF